MKGYKTLDLFYKSDILRHQATHLISIEVDRLTVKLHAWDRFFIEEYFDNDEQQVTKISIAETDDMLKYLEVISLDDLN